MGIYLESKCKISSYTDPIEESLCRKFEDSEIEKFLEEEEDLTIEDMKKTLPLEFHKCVHLFLPYNANSLPPHRAWDHKIEILPGK